MHATYQAFLDRMIHKYEGGYGWDRTDPGGPTKYGITCYDLAEHRGKKMNSMSAWAPLVKAMGLSEAEAIYWTKYAVGLRYDDLPAGVDVTMMDYGVNSGVSRPIHAARALLKQPGPAKVDSTLIAAIVRAGPAWFITAMDDERLAFMHRIRGGTAWRQNPGWKTRVADVRDYAEKVTKAPATPFVRDTLPAEKPMSKATHDDPQATKKVGTGVGGALSTALAGHVAGVPMSYLVVFVLGAVALGVGYYFYQKYVAAKLNAAVDVLEGKPVPGATGTGPASGTK